MMEKAKRKLKPGWRFNLQGKRYFEFVVELPLNGCMERIERNHVLAAEWFISRRQLIVSVKPVKPRQIFQFTLHGKFAQHMKVYGAGSIEKLSDHRTLIHGEAGLTAFTAFAMLFYTVLLGAAFISMLLSPGWCLSPLPMLFLLAYWHDAHKTRNSMVEYITNTLFFE